MGALNPRPYTLNPTNHKTEIPNYPPPPLKGALKRNPVPRLVDTEIQLLKKLLGRALGHFIFSLIGLPKSRSLNGGAYKVPLIVWGPKLGDLLSRSSRASGLRGSYLLKFFKSTT